MYLIINLKQAFLPCSICSKLLGIDANYPIINSKISFLIKTKLKISQEFNGCTRCSFLIHTGNNCKYRFKIKCKICDG